MTPVSFNDIFRFTCSKGVPCFNECCKDLNQFLTPYDILRLKNRMGIRSDIFLERYTTQHTGPGSGLPVVTFRTDQASGRKCPFVTSDGCSVYEDRPSSCRAYPLFRVVSRSRESGHITEQYILIKEPHCKGFDQGQLQSVKHWIKSQELETYNQMNDLMMEIIALKNRMLPGPLNIKSAHIFHLACYDLDAFRSRIFEKGMSGDYAPDLLEKAGRDDVSLLQLSLSWLKQMLFEL